jgi:hypothetical protein
MNKTSVMIEFVIVGDSFDIATVTNKLNITPTKSHNKNEAIKKRLQKKLSPSGCEKTCWTFSTGYEDSLNVDRQLPKIVDLFKPKIPILKTIAKTYDLEFAVNVVIEVRNNDIPSIIFNHAFIDFIHKIGAEVDIDLYIL